jgi:DNA polymerase/3'-5' exonuclease PolX
MDYHTARHLAERIVQQLAPHCEKVKICGSIRRHKSECRDIDLVVLPQIQPVKDLFGMVSHNERSPGFIQVVNSWTRLKGDPTGKYTQREIEGMKVEIAIASPNNFGNLVVIRTGNAEFSHQIMNWINKRGLVQKDGFLYKGDQQLVIKDEVDFFKTIGLPLIDPVLRDENVLKRYVQ